MLLTQEALWNNVEDIVKDEEAVLVAMGFSPDGNLVDGRYTGSPKSADADMLQENGLVGDLGLHYGRNPEHYFNL